MISFTKTRVGGIRASVACCDLLAQEASVILEVAVLNVRMGSEAAYEAAFQQASSIISAMPGYISHQLQRCIEVPNRYLLLVNWESLEAHTVGFRDSPSIRIGNGRCIIFMIRFLP